jgi:hypothetical protein
MPPKPKKKFNQIFVCLFSLENYDVDERLQKDIGDYISARMARSRAIQANVTPMAATPSAIGGRPPTLQSPQSPDGSGGNDVSPTARFQRHLVTLARGSFLFVSLTLDLIERGHIVAKSASYKVLPQTLAEIFRLEFNLRFASCSAFRQVSDLKFCSTVSLNLKFLGKTSHFLYTADRNVNVKLMQFCLIRSWHMV